MKRGVRCRIVASAIRASGANLRWTNSKLWFCGMQRDVEPIGAGVCLPDPGSETVLMNNISTQDTWGPGLHVQGNIGIVFNGDIDEAGGGRLEEQGLGYQGRRTLSRAFLRAPGTLRRAKITAEVKGGARLGQANRPLLLDMPGSAVQHCTFRFGGDLSHIATPHVATSVGHINANRYNEVWFENRLLHGQVSQRNLNTATHGVNDPQYGPTKVIREDGRMLVRSFTTGNWVQQ